MEKIKSLIKTITVSYKFGEREIIDFTCYIPLFDKPGVYTLLRFRHEYKPENMARPYDLGPDFVKNKAIIEIAEEIVKTHFKMKYKEDTEYKMFWYDNEIQWEERQLMLDKKDIMDCLKKIGYGE